MRYPSFLSEVLWRAWSCLSKISFSPCTAGVVTCCCNFQWPPSLDWCMASVPLLWRETKITKPISILPPVFYPIIFPHSTPRLLRLSTAPLGASWMHLQHWLYWEYRVPAQVLVWRIPLSTLTEDIHWNIWRQQRIPVCLERTPQHIIGTVEVCRRYGDHIPQYIHHWEQLFGGKTWFNKASYFCQHVP